MHPLLIILICFTAMASGIMLVAVAFANMVRAIIELISGKRNKNVDNYVENVENSERSEGNGNVLR